MAVEPRLWIDGRPAAPADLLQMAAVNYGAVTSFGYAQGGVRGLDMHMERLAASCRELFSCAFDKAKTISLIARAVEGLDEAWVRVTLTSPGLSIRAPERSNDVSIGIWVSPAASSLSDDQKIKSVSHPRELPHLKHLGMTGIIHARRQARQAGYDDALLLGEVGIVLEGTLWNIGFIRGDSVVWPEGPLLDGVTRRLISSGLAEQGIGQSTAVITLSDLHRFDGAFACNASTPAATIAQIDDHVFAGNPQMIQRLRDAWYSQPIQAI